MIQQMQYRPEPTPPPQPTASSFDIDDGDYLTGRQFKQALQQVQQQAQPQQQYVNQALTSTANLARGLAEQRNPDVFKRWGNEVSQLLGRIPPELQTLDNIQLIVDTVRGRHVEELAQERAQTLAAQMQDPTMRSLGGAGSGSVPTTTNQPQSILDNPSIPEAYRQRLKEQGLTDRSIHEFCSANGTTPEEFVKLFGNNVVAGG